jgi:hypothetical protein
MRNHGKRIEALEHGSQESEPYTIELVAGPSMGRNELDAMPPATFKAGARITRIELIGVLPEADIIPFGRPVDAVRS